MTNQSTTRIQFASGVARRQEVVSTLREFDERPRPLATVSVEKAVFGAKDTSELDYGTVRNAMEQTDERLCLRFENSVGHGFLALVDGELQRLMHPDSLPDGEYNGPFGISVDLLEDWLQEGDIMFTVREATPFKEES